MQKPVCPWVIMVIAWSGAEPFGHIVSMCGIGGNTIGTA